MWSKYKEVKFYDENDKSINVKLQRAVVPIILAFDESKEYDDINDIIEFYNISNLMKTGFRLPFWTDEQYEKYKIIVAKFKKPISKFFLKINDDNFIEQIQSVEDIYFEDFWTLFVHYKMYRHISPKVFLNYLKYTDTPLYVLLSFKELVDKYGEQLADFMRISDQTAEILAYTYLEKSGFLTCFIPKKLKPSEFEPIFLKYIESEKASPHYLTLIYKAPRQPATCPISDEMRLKAKHKLERIKEEGKGHLVIDSVVGVRFDNQKELEVICRELDKSWWLSYDVNWFEDNLDYMSILRNFWIVFKMFDSFFRCTLVNVQSNSESEFGTLEKLFMTMGARFYYNGGYFLYPDIISTEQTREYYDFLKKHDIDLEDVFQWFFEKYLPEELGVNGFVFLPSTPTATYLLRIRNLISEMEAVLKQFRMFVQNGEIDRELFEMSSGHVVFNTIPSLISNKYLYPKGDDIQHEMFALFSNRSPLSFTEKTTTKYSTLFEMLQSEEMVISDFDEKQQTDIEWLIEKGCLTAGKGILELVYPKTQILKDIYEHDVTCSYNYFIREDWSPTLATMISKGDLETESTLFTKPESEYLNYMLNKKEFSNGLDLRNKYEHGTNPLDEEEHKHDYIKLLKIMVLVITKIYDEFCYMDSEKNLTS